MIRLGILIVFTLLLIRLIFKGIKVIQQGEVMLVERLGAYIGKLTGGLHFLAPIIDAPKLVPWQFLEKDKKGNTYCVVKNVETIPLYESIFYILKQPILKRGYSRIELDILVYFMIENPEMAVYSVASLPGTFEEIITSALKNDSIKEKIIAGTCAIAENEIWEIVSEKAKKFGVKVNKIVIKNVR